MLFFQKGQQEVADSTLHMEPGCRWKVTGFPEMTGKEHLVKFVLKRRDSNYLKSNK